MLRSPAAAATRKGAFAIPGAMLALAALYLFGGEVIRSFTFAMLFGVAIGTYSSIYIAAPILIAFKLRPDTFQKKDEEKGAPEEQGTVTGI